MFSVGDLVVCVDDRFCAAAYEFCLQMPRKGEIYTVRWVGTRTNHGGGLDRIGVLLAEIHNPPTPPGVEPGFLAYRFKPVGISEHARGEDAEMEVAKAGFAGATPSQGRLRGA